MWHSSRRQRTVIKTVALCLSLCVGLLLFFYCTSSKESNDNDNFDLRIAAAAQNSINNKPLSQEAIDIDIDPTQLDFMHQEDPYLWKYIKVHHIVPPSTREYNLVDPNVDHGLATSSNPSGGQYLIVKRILKNMPKGFFVEAGAYDGEHFSNTLTLERELNWTGILIEADPLIFPYLKKKHRKAYLSDACLSPSARPQRVEFNHAVHYDIASKIGEPTNVAKEWTTFEVQCFPIYSILAAIGVTVVDYFSLDVEGIEMKVLESIPFDRVFIKVFSIEFQLVPEGPEIIKSFMKSKGYHLVAQTFLDFIFAHVSVLDIESLGISGS